MFESLYATYNGAGPIGETPSQANNRQGRGLFGSLLGSTAATPSSSSQANINEVVYFFGACQHPDSSGFNDWWRDDAKSFPVLRRLARDLFAAQMSTVAAESCFSAAGRTLSDKRSRLTPKSIRFFVMWKDMLDAETRTKELRYKFWSEDDEDDIFMRGYFANEEDYVPEEVTPSQTLGTSEDDHDFLAGYF